MPKIAKDDYAVHAEKEYGLASLKKIQDTSINNVTASSLSRLLAAASKPLSGHNGSGRIPLACNPNGSLLELAYKLKWAEKHYGVQNPFSQHRRTISHQQSHHGWLGGLRNGDSIVNGNFSPLDANVNFISHATSADIASPKPSRPYQDYDRPQAGAAFTPYEAHNLHVPCIQTESDIGLSNRSADDSADLGAKSAFVPVGSTPEKQSAALLGLRSSSGKRLKLDWENIFHTKVSLLDNIGGGFPGLWNVLTTTKEIKDMDYLKLLKTYHIQAHESAVKEPLNIRDTKDDENSMNGDDVAAFQAGYPVELNADLIKEKGDSDKVSSQNNLDAIAQTSDVNMVKESAKTKDDFSSMSDPLSEAELAIICEQAVNSALKAKTPARFLSQAILASSSLASTSATASAPATTTTASLEVSTNGLDTSGSTTMGLSPDLALDANKEMPRKHHCPHCPYQTDNRSHFRRHLSSVHAIGMPYYCYMCSKEFPRSEKVKAHFIKMHPAVAYDPLLVRKDKYFGSSGAGLYNMENSPHKPLLPDGRDKSLSPSSLGAAFGRSRDIPVADKVEQRPFLKYESSSPVPDGELPLEMTVDMVEDHTECPKPDFEGAPHNIVSPNGRPPVGLPSGLLAPLPAALPAAMQLQFGLPLSQSKRPVWTSAPVQEGKKRFYCPQCPYTGKDIWHLKRHINDVHNQKKDLKCPMCSYSTGRKHRLVSHMKNHGELFCYHCDTFRTHSMEQFQIHVKACAASKRVAPHECSKCGQKCMNRKQLQDHVFKTHGIIMFCCDKCMFYSEDPEEFEKHEQQHLEHIPNEYACQCCSEVFRDRVTLRQHIRSKHGDIKEEMVPKPVVMNENADAESLSCTLCDFKTRYRNVMKTHLDIHNGMLLQCDAQGCKFTTKWPRSLELHQRGQHPPTGPAVDPNYTRPQGKGTFVCPVCKDSRPPFRYKKSFGKHMRQHQMEAEPCPLCGEVFYIRASLKQHLQQEHEARVIEATSSSDESGTEDPARFSGTISQPISSMPTDFSQHRTFDSNQPVNLVNNIRKSPELQNN